jgi:hypothetical protein
VSSRAISVDEQLLDRRCRGGRGVAVDEFKSRGVSNAVELSDVSIGLLATRSTLHQSTSILTLPV